MPNYTTQSGVRRADESQKLTSLTTQTGAVQNIGINHTTPQIDKAAATHQSNKNKHTCVAGRLNYHTEFGVNTLIHIHKHPQYHHTTTEWRKMKISKF